MGEFVKVARLAELSPGRGRTVQANGRSVAVFHAGGRIYATANECAHRGGPLGEGALDGTTVTCPWHGFRFDVATGQCTHAPGLRVEAVPVRVEGEDVLVEV